jgi:hypothetical protein
MIPEQRTPQLPQLVVVLTAVHTPAQHICPAAHARPHAPQFDSVVCKLKHPPGHDEVPAGQRHISPWHVWPVAHRRPHAPQLASSPETSRHAPEQHSGMIPEQRTPQLPQLVVVLTAVHTPLQHICPAAHARPQAPQFELLLWRLTQPLGHEVPERQRQISPWYV